MTSAPCSYKAIASAQPVIDIPALSLFDSAHSPVASSPIDQFVLNTAEINKLYLPFVQQTQPFPRELGALVVLGYMSAVESYFRALIRGLVNIDEHTRRLAEPRTVSFGAALHHDSAMLPEALLEEISFAGSEGVKSAIRDFIGIKGQYPNEVQEPLTQFLKVCAIRHCCVHRFGQLGARNAMTLGLQDYGSLLEKPFAPTVVDLQKISDVLRTFVISINNFVFRSLLERSAKNKNDQGGKMYSAEWTWKYTRDRRRFGLYYGHFASREDVQPSASAKALYDDFRDQMKVR